MRILICGSRDWTDKDRVFQVIDQFRLEFTEDNIEILEGGGYTGADHFARDYARDHELTFINVPAKWNELGKKAGPMRNERMLYYYEPDMVIGFHNDIENSKGTKHMLTIARGKVPTYLVTNTNVEKLDGE